MTVDKHPHKHTAYATKKDNAASDEKRDERYMDLEEYIFRFDLEKHVSER